MKKILCLLFVACVSFSPVFAKNHIFLQQELSKEVKNVISLKEMTSDNVKKMVKELDSTTAIECKAGTSFPLRYFGDFRIFSLKFAPKLTFKVEKDCHLRVVQEKVFISFDLKTWKNIKECLDHDTSVGISADKQSLEVRTELREE